jgi:hypothetical protein
VRHTAKTYILQARFAKARQRIGAKARQSKIIDFRLPISGVNKKRTPEHNFLICNHYFRCAFSYFSHRKIILNQ